MVFGTYRQYDSRWGKKNYNGSSNYANAGCGPTACANILYAINKKITPITTGNYMKANGYAIRNNGTAWNGIPACLKHFGAKDVRQVDKMADVFNYCSKGYVGVFLFRKGTKGGVTWTTAGHYIAITGYKVSNGKHYFKTFDSGGRKHDGWYCYETTMKGLIPRIWLCKLEVKVSTTTSSTSTRVTKPTIKYSGVIPSPTLKNGSKGDGVKNLQKFLNWYHKDWDLKEDGSFGTKTGAALMAFQYIEGLKQDGVYGKNSYNKALAYKQTTTTTKPATSSTKPTSSATKTKKCIDVSYWQGKITVDNWKKIKKTCDYAICRASYTSTNSFKLSKDSTFETNFKNAKDAGLRVGAYHYSQALTVAEAKKEAEYICSILKGKSPTFYVVIDYEYGGRLKASTAGKANDVVNAFCDVVKSKGFVPCIYANTSTLDSKIKNPKYPVWVAQYASKCTYKGKKVLWQYTSSGKVDGISAKSTNNGTDKVDLSYVYDVYSLEESKKPQTTTQTKPQSSTTTKPTTTPSKVETSTKKNYSGIFPSENTNTKIINGLAYRMCYPYGTPEKKYTFKDGKPTQAYKDGIDKAYPNHSEWPNKRQKAGACCDIFVGTVLGLIGIKVKKDLKDQLVDMPKMTSQLKSNGHCKASEFKLGDIVQRGRKDKSGHTWVVCELVNGNKYVANSHYKHLKGCYAVMDAKPATIVPSKWAYYKCYTVQGAFRTYYRKDDYGYDIVYIQKFLNWYGIKCTADGDFGAKTEEAVKQYQEKRGLTVDGKVGKKTIADMKLVTK